MSRRVLIRAVSFLLFAFLVLAAIAVQNANRSREYKQVISDTYGYAFAELVADISKLDYALQKSNYASTRPLMTSLCAEIYRESASCMAALSQLPVSELNLENTAKFLSRTGDYAYNMSRKVARGETISQKEREELATMSGRASEISRMLHVLSEKMQAESIDIADVKLSGSTEGGPLEDIVALEQEFSEYPVLIYDGPFSDHINEKESNLISNIPQVSEEEAKANAAKILGCDKNVLVSDGVRKDGKIEVYAFHGDMDEYSVYVDVTKHGGIVLRLISSREAETAKLTIEKAIERAKDVLHKIGFENMQETYHIRYENNLTVNFATHQNGTVIYPDLVKVTIALDDGSITNLDATGYIINHHERNPREISNGRARAEKLVSKELKILSYQQAISPTSGGGEVLTHEFKCENSSGQHCIVYINAETYNEEKILILLEDENGTLVM